MIFSKRFKPSPLYGNIQMYVRTWFGLFTVKDDKIVNCSLFPKDVHNLAERLVETPTAMSSGKICNVDLPTLAMTYGFVNSAQEYYGLLQEVTLRAARNKIRSQWKKDAQIIQAINTLDELDGVINLLQERLYRSYTLHFPEHELHGEALAEFVVSHGSRANIPATHPLYEKAVNSTGMDISDEEEQLLKALAENLLHLYRLRRQSEDYLNSALVNMAPNLSGLIGALLTARLISLAGSLEKLACKPASTIQVMGASKALFKHLRKHTPPPKHGVIYQHPLIKNAPLRLRGRIARALAAKIAIAARIDLYTGVIKPQIKHDLERQMARIKEGAFRVREKQVLKQER
jgi:nucleolar protein 56